MIEILSYMYKTWRLGANGYAMLSIGIALGLAFIIAIIITIIKSGRDI